MDAPPDPLATPSAGAKAGWVDGYLNQLKTQRQLSPHTLAAYRRDLHTLAELSGDAAWQELGHNDIRKFASRLHAQELDPRSIARKLSAWRGFYRWLGLQTPLAANPVEGVRPPKRAKTLPKALSVDDAVHLVGGAARLTAEAEPAALCNRAMFELFYSSGLRVSELAALDLRYVKAEAGMRESLGWLEAENREVVVTGKGNKRRRVPVGGHALDAIAAWLAVRPAARDGGAALFLSARASRITPRVIQLRLKAHARAVGVPADVHPHMLRHSFASHVLQSSGDLRAVQDMLGHASIASTQVYTALDFQHLAKIYDQAHPRAKIK